MLVLEKWQMEQLIDQLRKQKPIELRLVWENKYWPGYPSNVVRDGSTFFIGLNVIPDLKAYKQWVEDTQPATFSMQLAEGFMHMHVIIQNVNSRELELAVGMQYGLHHEDRG